MIEVNPQPSATVFLDRAETWLQENEPTHRAILSVARLLQGESHFEPPFYLATVKADDRVCGCALRAAPDGLYLTDLPQEAMSTIIEQLRGLYSTLPEVTGPEPIATAFAERWNSREWRLHIRCLCYRVKSVVEPSHRAKGSLRKGLASDLSLLHEWAPEYARESDARLDMQLFFERMIKRGLLYLWDDNGARCVVTTSKLTPNGAEISSVYTPPRFRRKGYATAAVAAASRCVLDSGRKYCMIAADERASETNRLYRNIGYEQVGELVVIHL
ncbi:MAG TPA: GNAT family N-acetyltransferase [Gammaproteobacteria bacterium]|jgi:hypothetical protein